MATNARTKYPEQKIREMAESGKSLYQIANELSISYHYLRKLAKKKGIKTNWTGENSGNPSGAMKYPLDKIRKMIEVDGKTCPEVAKALDYLFDESVSQKNRTKSIWSFANRNGINMSKVRARGRSAAIGEERVFCGVTVVKTPGHTKAMKRGGWVKKAYLLAEASLGRPLRPWERVRIRKGADLKNPTLEDVCAPRTKRSTHCENCGCEVRVSRSRLLKFDVHFCGRECMKEYYGNRGSSIKISDETVVAIREGKSIGLSTESLAEQYGISAGYVLMLAYGDSRASCGGPILKKPDRTQEHLRAFSDEQVIDMRIMLARGEVSVQELANKHGVANYTIHRIRRGVRYSHVPFHKEGQSKNDFIMEANDWRTG